MNTLELLNKAREANDKALALAKMGLHASAKALQVQVARWINEATKPDGSRRQGRAKHSR